MVINVSDNKMFISNKVYDENIRKIRQFCKKYKGKDYTQPYYMDDPKNPKKSNFKISCNLNPKKPEKFSIDINNPDHGGMNITGIRGDKNKLSELDSYSTSLAPENINLFLDDLGLLTCDRDLFEEEEKKRQLREQKRKLMGIKKIR